MTPEHWLETLIVALGVCGGIAVWAFGIEARLRVLERSFDEHVQAKKEVLGDLKHELHAIKIALEQLTRRCFACRHYETHGGHSTLAGELGEVEEDSGP